MPQSSSSEKKKITLARKRLRRAKERAKKKGIEFSLTFEWMMEHISKGKCELSGMSFDYSTKGANSSRVPSIDRIDSDKGYTEKNCRVILWGLNAGICNWGLDETVVMWREVMNNAQLIN